MSTKTEVSWQEWVSRDDYFDDLAVLGIGPFHPGGLEATRALIEARSWEGLRVLDVGAGQGTTMRFLAAEGADVTGIEPSPYMREAARRHGIERSRILPETVESISLETTFDAIVAEGVLGFVEQPVEQLLRLADHLEESGELFVSDWEPHDRESDADYGFEIPGRHSSDALARELAERGFSCHVERAPTVASAFSLGEAEALRRASRYFSDAPPEALEAAVPRKLANMRRALPNDVPCDRYVLRAVRDDAEHVDPD